MNRPLLGIALLTLGFSSPALAVGIDLQWNECIGAATVAFNKNFTCTGTMNQSYYLVMQFKTGQDIPAFVAATAILDFQDESPGELPPFWHFENGGCQRSGSIQGLMMFDTPASITPADPANGCVAQDDVAGGDGRMSDPWNGDGSGGTESIALYIPDSPIPGHGRLALVDSKPNPFTLTAGRNYYAFDLRFSNRLRTTCSPGCADKVSILFNLLALESDDGSPAVYLAIPDKGSICAVVNGASVSTCAVTPTKNTTWGQLKAMYR